MNSLKKIMWGLLLTLMPGLCAGSFETKVDGIAYMIRVEKLASIYGRVWPGVRAEVSHNVWKMENLHLWGGVDYLQVTGESIGLKSKTTMTLIPFGLGARITQKIGSKARFQFSAGPKYTLVDINNESAFVPTHLKKQAWGGGVNSGLDLMIKKNLFIDMTFGYFYTKVPNSTYSGTVTSNDLIISTINVASGMSLRF